jgi:DNA-binding response OmpR family regulator
MRILLAEDERKVAEHVREGLAAEGYAVDLAPSGDEALWLATTNPYDALVLDIMMPGHDGFSVVRQLRRKQIFTPVIFLTARSDVEDRVRGIGCGSRRLFDQTIFARRTVGSLARVVAAAKASAHEHSSAGRPGTRSSHS